MRKVFLDDLPRRGIYIDWKNSAGNIVKFVYDDIEGEVEIIEYDSRKSIITVLYNGNEKDIPIGDFRICRIGRRMLGIKDRSWLYSVGDNICSSKMDIIIIGLEYRVVTRKDGREEREKWCKYKCNRCGNEDWKREGSIKKDEGCRACCKSGNRIPIVGVNTIWDTDRWMVDLGMSEEDAKCNFPNSDKKVKVICPDCGHSKKIIIGNMYRRKSIKCICGDGFSYPEKFMTNVLTQLNVGFKTQYSPDYLIKINGDKKSRMYSDFYLPKYKLIIESDGSLGHEGGKVHGYSNKTLEEHIEIDNWKDEQHKIHGIETIRINCFESDMEYIKNNILESKLNEIFDLSNIDWLQCEEFAINNNKIKEVCDYWNNKEEWETTKDLENIFKTTAVRRYLKKGTKLGWCDYSSKDEARKVLVRNRINNKKPVIAYKDNVVVMESDSIKNMCKELRELTGEHFNSDSVSESCRGIRGLYKGICFKYK